MQDVVVHVTGGAISKEESDAYVARGREKYGRALERVDVKLDGEYAANRSVLLDLRILFKSVGYVLKSKGICEGANPRISTCREKTERSA